MKSSVQRRLLAEAETDRRARELEHHLSDNRGDLESRVRLYQNWLRQGQISYEDLTHAATLQDKAAEALLPPYERIQDVGELIHLVTRDDNLDTYRGVFYALDNFLMSRAPTNYISQQLNRLVNAHAVTGVPVNDWPWEGGRDQRRTIVHDTLMTLNANLKFNRIANIILKILINPLLKKYQHRLKIGGELDIQD